VEVDQRAVFVEENSENGHGGLRRFSHSRFAIRATSAAGLNWPRFIL